MRATLIFPGTALGGWAGFGKGGTSSNFMPYGLAYIAACAKRDGHEIDLLDMRKLRGWDHFEEEVHRRSPGVFGISAMSVDFPAAAEAASRIKAADASSKVIIGGVHPTVATAEVEKLPQFDHIVAGEGELAFSGLLSELGKGGRPARVILGQHPDIDSLPYPDRDLFDYANGEALHAWQDFMSPPFVSIIAGRGCPFKCSFCQPAERLIFGGRAKVRKVPDIIGELRLLRDKYRFNSLLVHDDLFTINRAHVLDFCDAYSAEGFGASFACQARADFIVNNEDVVKRMATAGLGCFLIGFESASQRILDLLKKGTTVEQNRRAAGICAKHGIRVFGNFMMGIPGETEAEVRETVKFIREIRPDYPSIAFFTPYPGTELGDQCARDGLLLQSSANFYDRSSESGGKLKGIDYDFLKAAASKAQDYPRTLRPPAGRPVAAPGSSGFAARAWRTLRDEGPAGLFSRAAGRIRMRRLYKKYGF